MKLPYLLLDVFTERPLSGNPLAVVPEAEGLLDGELQAIAREFNLSETIFFTKAKSERNATGIRIFTPAVELPFAGHPTVGAAVVIGLRDRLQIVRLEGKVGLITSVVESVSKTAAKAVFGLPRLPERIGDAPSDKAIARALGLEDADIGCDQLRPAMYSAGNPFYLVPVRNAAALARVKPLGGVWALTFPEARQSVYIFTATPEEPKNAYAARMFAPGMGLGEDPGTGAAAAALIGLLSDTFEQPDGQRELAIRQGTEMGRPCRILMQIRKQNGVLTHGGIGGHAVIIGEGALNLG
ncbi:MAG: Phenazine biosynthesis protein PhzF like protein [Devosia sp.]|nr:Phenazine biosynthesis protein PhzF like protein [Devosia sp.]